MDGSDLMMAEIDPTDVPEELKLLQRFIDEALETWGRLGKKGCGSRELSLMRTNLQQARMWLKEHEHAGRYGE